eukprot:s396_g27.t1
MGRVKGAAVLAVGGGLCLAPSFVPLLSSSSEVRAGGHVGPESQTSFMTAGPRSPGAGMPLALVGTAALLAVRSTRMVRRAKKEKEPASAEEEAEKVEAAPKESVADKASETDSAESGSAEADTTESPPEPEEKKPTGFQSAVGATPPLGFWDPAKLCKSEDDFKKFRVAELKHGRVAMMAALGAVVQHFITFPGFDDVPRGMEALTDGTGLFGFLLLVAGSGYLELEQWNQKADAEPGNFGDPLGLAEKKIGAYDEEWRNKELNNGRFAMFAAIGIILAENETGLDAVEQIFGI